MVVGMQIVTTIASSKKNVVSEADGSILIKFGPKDVLVFHGECRIRCRAGLFTVYGFELRPNTEYYAAFAPRLGPSLVIQPQSQHDGHFVLQIAATEANSSTESPGKYLDSIAGLDIVTLLFRCCTYF